MRTRAAAGSTVETLPILADGIAAAQAGDVAALQAWLAAGPSVDAYDATGWTPLLWAAARGHVEAIQTLLDAGADPGHGHRESHVLPVHLAAQAGSVPAVALLLDRCPEHLNAVYDINGHTALLQAVFYGHLPLAEYLVQRGADTSITTARGLGPLELAAQFQNHAMVDVIRPYDATAEAKAAYYQSYLDRVGPKIPEDRREAQALSDKLVGVIAEGLAAASSDAGAVDRTLDAVKALVAQGADVNRLGGALQQPPLIVAVTGNNGFPPNPAMARLRKELAAYLLEQGADPTRREEHPMGAQTIIRAAVFNHLEILRMCGGYITPQQLADAINEWPLVNGLTAMHDTVLRSIMAEPDRFEGYLDQARWFVANGGRADIEDFSGQTQRALAETAKDPAVRQRLLDVLDGRATGK